MQAQPPQGPRRHRLARRSVAVLEALAQNPVHALEPLPLAVRLECTEPLAAPSLDSLAGAAQLWVGEGHRDLRQIESLPQRGVPALLTEQLLDIRQVIRAHPRLGRDSSWMGVPRLVTAVRSALLSVSVLHESCLRECGTPANGFHAGREGCGALAYPGIPQPAAYAVFSTAVAGAAESTCGAAWTP